MLKGPLTVHTGWIIKKKKYENYIMEMHKSSQQDISVLKELMIFPEWLSW